jgi:2-dehydropantoate 2-reductase
MEARHLSAGFSEVAAVDRARAVDLPADIEATALQFTRNAPPELMPSMAVDLLHGKRLYEAWPRKKLTLRNQSDA